MKDHSGFLLSIRNYVKVNPEAAAYISDFVASGLEASRKEILERAADMEVALHVAMARKYNGADDLILHKLEKWAGKSANDWSSTIKMLKEKGAK